MKNPLLLHFIGIFLALFLCTCKKEKPESKAEVKKYGNLEGVVKNAYGQPVEGALISSESSSAKTDANGNYKLNNLEVKAYAVNASKDNYLPKTENITITENSTAILNFTLSAGKGYLTISDSIITLVPSGGVQSIRISSNAGWTVQNKSSWITTSTTGGDGNGSLAITCPANKGNADRMDTLIIVSGSIQKPLIIKQSVSIELLSYEGIIGNDELKIQDSVYLHFNKAIKTIGISTSNSFCISDIKYKLVDNNKGVMFSYGCASLGGSYPFNIIAVDDNGNNLTKDITVPFYKAKLDVPGFISNYIFVNDEKEVIISTFNPAKLIRYSIVKNAIVESYDMSTIMAPIELTYSPYDGKVYFMGTDANTTGRMDGWVRKPDVYSLNLQTGTITKEFTVKAEAADGPYPINIPYHLAFTKNGSGVIMLRSNQSSGIKWRLIDAAKNYEITAYKGTINNADYFDNAQLNYDQTKIFITQTYTRSCDYGVFDSATQGVSIVRPSLASGSVFITPNKKTDKIYVGQLYEQFIMDLRGNLSKVSYLDNRNYGSADFSYRPNEENFVYFSESGALSILDYNKAVTTMKCGAVPGLTKFGATVDGNLAVAYKLNNDLSSSLFVFETKGLYRNAK